jgi:hypothetical protein
VKECLQILVLKLLGKRTLGGPDKQTCLTEMSCEDCMEIDRDEVRWKWIVIGSVDRICVEPSDSIT